MSGPFPAAIAAKPIESRADGEAFVRALFEAGLDFHFEDDPSDIINLQSGEAIFSDEEAELVAERIHEAYECWGGGREDCPIGFLLQLIEERDGAL